MPIDRAKVLKQANQFMASGKVERAIEEFHRLMEDKPDDPNPMNSLGDAYLQIGRNADAMEWFKRAARGFEHAGYAPKAAAVLKKAHRAAPEDMDISSRLADAYRQTNMIKDAIQIHIDVAEHYTKKGLLKRALEEFAKVVELDPKHLKNKIKLADLYNREGMKERAAEIYLDVAEALALEGRHDEATQVVERAKTMVSTPKVFLTLSRLAVIQKDFPGALHFLREGLSSNPNSSEILEATAEVELQVKAPERAMEAIAQIPQASERAALICERALRELARANRAEEGLRLFKRIGLDLARRGLGDQASRVVQQSLQGLPFPTEAWLQLAEFAQQSGDRNGRINALSHALHDAQNERDAALIQNISQLLTAMGVDPSQVSRPETPSGTASVARPEADLDPVTLIQIEQLEREGEQYLRNRFNDKAMEAFQRILEFHPAHLGAINRLAEIIRSTGRMSAVHAHYLKHADKLAQQGQTSMALRLLDQAEELFPGSTRVQRRMLGLTSPQTPPPAPPPPPAPTGPPPIALSSGPQAPLLPPPPPLPSPALGTPIQLQGEDTLVPPTQTTPEPPPAPLDIPGGPAYGRPPERSPSGPLPLRSHPTVPEASAPEPLSPEDLAWGDLVADEAPVPGVDAPPLAEIVELELEPLTFAPDAPTLPASGMALPVFPTLPAAGPVAPPMLQPIPMPPAMDEELSGLLPDIDFQIDYGSPDEALIEIQNALQKWPDHPELLERQARTQDILTRLGHASSPTQELEEEQDLAPSFFDLTDVLGDSLLAAQEGEGEEMHDATHLVEKVQSVEELFDAFREGVEGQVQADDYDTHYNLGIAYKEMMLLEPAMEEFRKAMADPERTMECCSMLAICEQSQGNLEGASAWLNKGISAPGFPPEDSIGLRFDLGELLEQMGRREEAREHFRTVYELDPTYRDVENRI